MLLLYCADPLSRRRPDVAYAEEVAAAQAAGLDHALIRLEALVDADDAEEAVAAVPASTATPRLGVYRGWMLRPPQYARLYEALAHRGVRLINDPDAYVACHLLPTSYHRIVGLTPRSVWLPMTPGSPLPDWSILSELLQPFGDQPIVVKDYVKSRKHEWKEACYIPDASDRAAVEWVVGRFLDLQGPDLEGGLVFREFVRFVPLGIHPMSGMPLTREFRFFWLDGEPLALAPYWELADDGGDMPSPETFRAVAVTINSRFFSMDVAQRQNDGASHIMEFGDGQVAGVPEQLDVAPFYLQVRAALTPDRAWSNPPCRTEIASTKVLLCQFRFPLFWPTQVPVMVEHVGTRSVGMVSGESIASLCPQSIPHLTWRTEPMGTQKRHPERVYQLVGKPGQGAPAVGYVRYSSDMQDPASIITQKRRIQEYAEGNGWDIVRWYEEPEASAKFEEIDERPVFAELLADAGQEFHIVLCYTNDRWARNMAVAYSTLSQLRRKRVWWATADGRWDIDKVEQDGFDVAFAMDTQINAAFVRRLSERAIDGKEDRARDGYHNGSVPFGYLPPEYPKPPDAAPSTWRPPRMPVRRDPVNFPALVKIGELAAHGWSDAAIADELAGYMSTTPRFGKRPLSKDTIWAIRHMWFPREFAPGCGHGTIETPSGELVEGRHPAAWPYEMWQKMVEVKSAHYRRPRTQTQRHAKEFSRIVVCAGCRRALRAEAYDRKRYYRDTSEIRKLPCPAFGSLSVPGAVMVSQFGDLLKSINLPDGWRNAVAERCQETDHDSSSDTIQAYRTELEAEEKRTVLAFTKGYMTEHDLDSEIERIRGELQALPPSRYRSIGERTEAAIVAGEMLTDMTSYWEEAFPEERRDMLWTLFQLGGLFYDLERRAIVGLLPRLDVLPALTIGLGPQWDLDGDTLRLKAELLPPKLERSEMTLKPYLHKLTPQECEAALKLVADGKSLRQVAAHFNVSRMSIWRILDANNQKKG